MSGWLNLDTPFEHVNTIMRASADFAQDPEQAGAPVAAAELCVDRLRRKADTAGHYPHYWSGRKPHNYRR
jgi:hypothetical protein